MTSHRHGSPRPTTNTTADRFGWRWIWRSLLCRRWELAAVLLTTLCVYIASLALPIFTQKAVDAVVAQEAGPFLLLLGAGALTAVIAEAVFTNLRVGMVIRLGGFLDQRIANLAFLHLMRMRLDAHGHATGDLINRFQQAGKVKNFVLHLVPTVVFDIGNAIISLLLMLYFDAVIAAVVFVVTLACTALLKGRLDRLYDLADDHYKTEGERQGTLSETVTGLRTIKALASEGWRYREWADKTAAVVAAARRVSDLARRFSISTQLASRGLALLVIAIGCYRVLQGDLTVGELLALQLLVARVTTPIIQSGDVLRQYQEVAVAIAALRAFLAAPREVPGLRPGRRRFVDGGLDARNVTLVYPKSSRPALDDVSFSLPGAGVFAVVGRNGSGKTSLLRVLLGLQRDFAGQALIHGEDVRHYDPRWLRGRAAGCWSSSLITWPRRGRRTGSSCSTGAAWSARDSTTSFAGIVPYTKRFGATMCGHWRAPGMTWREQRRWSRAYSSPKEALGTTRGSPIAPEVERDHGFVPPAHRSGRAPWARERRVSAFRPGHDAGRHAPLYGRGRIRDPVAVRGLAADHREDRRRPHGCRRATMKHSLGVILLLAALSAPVFGQERVALRAPGDAAAEVELFISVPDGDGPWPAILYVHGHQIGSRPGARVFARLGDRPRLATIDEGRLERMAERGYVAAAVSMPGYGGSSGPPDFCGPRTQAAVETALSYLWGQPFVDRDRIVLYGVSRGATTAAMVATRAPRLRALILVAGTYDLGEQYPTGRPRLDDNIETEAGTTEDAFAARSALRHADGITAATLILHGGRDSTAGQARRLAEKLRTNGVFVRERVFEGFGHQLPIPLQYEEIDTFLELALGRNQSP